MVNGTVNPGIAGTVTNQAGVTTATTDTNMVNNSSSCVTLVLPVPIVTNTMPDMDTIDVPLDEPIVVGFDQPIDSLAVDINTFKVYWEQHGPYSGMLTVTNNQITFTPAIDYRPGEWITVTLTDGIKSMLGAPAEPYIFQFITRATGCAVLNCPFL